MIKFVACDLDGTLLLNGAQSLGGGCVTPENNEMAPHIKEFHHSLTGELIYHIEAA